MQYSIVSAIVLFMFFVTAGQFTARAQALQCGINAVTFSTTGYFLKPTISDNGQLVAFSANRDITGQNGDGNWEIFLHDSDTGTTSQLTDTLAIFGSHSPHISGDGTKIAFVSDRNVNGANPDASFEVFIFDLETSATTQLTFSATNNTIESIDDTGSQISLYSYNDFTGGNADVNGEIFVLDVETGQFVQVTTSTGGGFLHGGSKLSGNGQKLGFGSHLNLAGIDPDGKYDAFSYDLATGSLSQISQIGTQGIPGEWNTDGSKYVFYSNGYPAPNPEANFELFLYDAATGGTQMLTDTGAGIYNTQPTFNGAGDRISFFSTNDWTGGNADGFPEIYLLEAGTGSMTQVTYTDNYEMLDPIISDNGERIVFSSNLFADLGNADGNYEIFLAECLAPPSADLAIGIGSDRSTARAGQVVTYTVTVDNFGPDNAANVVVNSVIPSGSTFVSANASKGNFTAPPVGQSGTVTWNLGTLADSSQESAQIAVTVLLKGKGTVTNTASVTASTSDPNTANNSASLSISLGGGKK